MTNLPAQPATPIEDVNRGTVVALLAIPAGIIVFVLVWSIGFIASAVTLGVAYLARFLYLLGSGRAIGRTGAVRVTIITIATVILSIVAGLITDVALAISQVAQISPIEALSVPQFSQVLEVYLTEPELQYSPWPSVLIALGFGLLGCFSILRATFRAAAAPAAGPTDAPIWPQNTAADPFAQQNPVAPQQPVPPTDDTPRAG